MKCLICGFERELQRNIYLHIKIHGCTAVEYKKRFNLEKKCEKCGTVLSKNCSGTVCKKCYDWTGQNNPFWGRTHSEETRARLKDVCVESSRRNWEKNEYRERVIKAVSKPRREGFAKEQSVRTKEWYAQNPDQRVSRSKKMKESWKEGRIQPNVHSFSESKKEIAIREEIAAALPNSRVEKKTIKIGDKWYLPDVIIDDWIIVEFFGDYWHASPERYGESDIVHHRKTAKEIREKDQERIEELRKRYRVFVVWEKTYDDGNFDLDGLVEEVMLVMDDG